MQWNLTVDTTGAYDVTATNTFSLTATGDNSSGEWAYYTNQAYWFQVNLVGGPTTGVNLTQTKLYSFLYQVSPGAW